MPRRNRPRRIKEFRAECRRRAELNQVEPTVTPQHLAWGLVRAGQASPAILGPIGSSRPAPRRSPEPPAPTDAAHPLGEEPPKVRQTSPQGRALSGARLSKLFDGSEAGT